MPCPGRSWLVRHGAGITKQGRQVLEGVLQACVAEAEAAGSPRGITRRQGDAALAKSHAQQHGPQFVSVQLAPSARRPALTIELISRGGERMRIESAEGLDLADVVQGFWSRRA